MLRIIFAGTPQLACASLERLYQNQEQNNFAIIGILTQADQMAGRKRHLQPSPIKTKALELGINPKHIFTPEKLGPDLRNQIAEQKPDLLAVFAYGKIFRQKFLNLFPLGGINLHPSTLPQWRGPSPIEAQLRSGSKQLGITIQQISLEMDAGDIIIQKQFPLPELADYHQAAEIASHEGAKMLYQTCSQIATQAQQTTSQATTILQTHPQDHNKATYCSLISKQDGLIDWQQSAQQIARNCRAYAAWPKTYTYFTTPATPLGQTETIQILSAREWQGNPKEQQQIEHFLSRINTLQAGTLLTFQPQTGLLVLCGNKILAIEKLQRQNRKAVSAHEFANQLKPPKQSPTLPESPTLPNWQQLESTPENQTLYTFTNNEPRTTPKP